jgi:hypothetical protein
MPTRERRIEPLEERDARACRDRCGSGSNAIDACAQPIDHRRCAIGDTGGVCCLTDRIEHVAKALRFEIDDGRLARQAAGGGADFILSLNAQTISVALGSSETMRAATPRL